MSAPTVSVIMPVFDPGPALARALASVAAQTFADRELVIVDDGSRLPETRRRLDEAATQPGVRLVRTENQGPSAARNRAITEARGRFILPLDADDWLEPRYLERTVPVLGADPGLGVVHPWVGLTGAHRGVWRTGEFAIPALLVRCTVHIATLFRRELWEQVGGFDPAFHETGEDWDFWIAAAAHGWRGQAVPEVLCWYNRRPDSREAGVRATGRTEGLVTRLVQKHEALYRQHVAEVVAGVHAELATVSTLLDRVYGNPFVRLALDVRDRLGGRFRGRPRP